MAAPPPESAITGFHQDEDGHWVAELECGHTQHVRHKPPQEVRAWVTTEAGRQSRVGERLLCPFCRMKKPPAGLVEYKRTAEFNRETVPVGLTRTHTLKAGTWGELVVLEGHVVYVLEAQDDGTGAPRVVLRAGVPGVIAPEAPHHIEPAAGSRFFVRFLRVEAPTGEGKTEA